MEICAFKELKMDVISKPFFQMPHILIQEGGDATWNIITYFLHSHGGVGLKYFFNISDLMNNRMGQVFHATCNKTTIFPEYTLHFF